MLNYTLKTADQLSVVGTHYNLVSKYLGLGWPYSKWFQRVCHRATCLLAAENKT